MDALRISVPYYLRSTLGPPISGNSHVVSHGFLFLAAPVATLTWFPKKKELHSPKLRQKAQLMEDPLLFRMFVLVAPTAR